MSRDRAGRAPEQRTVLVTGATGSQGGALARILLGRGHDVRALTRHPDSEAARGLAELGADVRRGDFEDALSIRAAAEGVDVAFLMGTPFEEGPEGEERQATRAAEAMRGAGVGHLVYSSVASANQHTGIPHFESKARVEDHVRRLGLPYTIVAPVFFMENLHSPMSLPALKEGRVALGLPPDRRLQQVALADLAGFIALVVEQPDRFVSARIEVASDEVAGADMARVLTHVGGRTFTYHQIPLEQLRAMSEDFAAMYEWFQDVGFSVDIAALHRDYPEVAWRGFEAWARGQDWRLAEEPAIR